MTSKQSSLVKRCYQSLLKDHFSTKKASNCVQWIFLIKAWHLVKLLVLKWPRNVKRDIFWSWITEKELKRRFLIQICPEKQSNGELYGPKVFIAALTGLYLENLSHHDQWLIMSNREDNMSSSQTSKFQIFKNH